MKPEDFKEPIEIPKVRFTANTLQDFRDIGKNQIPNAVLEQGSVAQTGFLLRGDELPDGTLVPIANETEISAMREIFTSLQRSLTTPSGASTPDNRAGTGFYL
jgi:hypothetical protein